MRARDWRDGKVGRSARGGGSGRRAAQRRGAQRVLASDASRGRRRHARGRCGRRERVVARSAARTAQARRVKRRTASRAHPAAAAQLRAAIAAIDAIDAIAAMLRVRGGRRRAAHGGSRERWRRGRVGERAGLGRGTDRRAASAARSARTAHFAGPRCARAPWRARSAAKAEHASARAAAAKGRTAGPACGLGTAASRQRAVLSAAGRSGAEQLRQQGAAFRRLWL